VDDLWATKSESGELSLVELVSKISNLCGPDAPTSQTDGQTDRRTTGDGKTALCTIVHHAVKTRKNFYFYLSNIKYQLFN